MTYLPVAPGKYQTPRVPVETPMFDARTGNLTRTWIIFFERLGRRVDETVTEPAVTEDFEEATVIIYETAVASNVTNLLPVRRGGTLVDCEIVPKFDTTADFEMDILLTPAGDPFASRSSIFAAGKLLVPGGTAAGTVINQDVFASDPFDVAVDDVLSCDILDSDGGANVYTAVLKWRVAPQTT